jgi:hypothetical protein
MSYHLQCIGRKIAQEKNVSIVQGQIKFMLNLCEKLIDFKYNLKIIYLAKSSV